MSMDETMSFEVEREKNVKTNLYKRNLGGRYV